MEFDRGFDLSKGFSFGFNSKFSKSVVDKCKFVITDCVFDIENDVHVIKLNLDLVFDTGNVYKYYNKFRLVNDVDVDGIARYIALLKSIRLISKNVYVNDLNTVMFNSELFVARTGYCKLSRKVTENSSGDMLCSYKIIEFLYN